MTDAQAEPAGNGSGAVGPRAWLVVFDGAAQIAPALVRAMLDAAAPDGGMLHIRTPTGAPVQAACGAAIRPDGIDWPPVSVADLVIVVAGRAPAARAYLPLGLRGFVRGAQAKGALLLGLEDGAAVLTAMQAAPDAAGRVVHASGLDAVPPIHGWIAARLGTAAAARAAARIGWRAPAAAPTPHDAPRGDPVIGRMRAIMRAQLAAPLPLNLIAGQLGLSAKQMRHRSRRVLGATPGQVYLGERLDHAAGLVRDTALPVADIAAQAGFASASSFTRAFRAHHGHSPRAMRGGTGQPDA